MPIGQFKAVWWCSLVTIASCATRWPNMQLMQVVPSGGKICNWCKWHHLVAKYATDRSLGFLHQGPTGTRYPTRTQFIFSFQDIAFFALFILALIFTLAFIWTFLLHFLNSFCQHQFKSVSQKRTRMNTSGQRQSETGDFDPLISSSSSTTSKPSKTFSSSTSSKTSKNSKTSKTFFFCFIGFLLCFSLSALLLVHNLWELYLSDVDNQGRIPTVTTTFWELFPVYSEWAHTAGSHLNITTTKKWFWFHCFLLFDKYIEVHFLRSNCSGLSNLLWKCSFLLNLFHISCVRICLKAPFLLWQRGSPPDTVLWWYRNANLCRQMNIFHFF